MSKVPQNSGKAPSYQMYPLDWNADPNLKAVSYAAQGFWVRLCNESHHLEVPGLFVKHQNGHVEAMTKEQICDSMPGRDEEKSRLFDELVAGHVLKLWKDILLNQKSNLVPGFCLTDIPDFAYVCKRRYLDARLNRIRTQVGAMGGNPRLNEDLPLLLGDLLNQNANQKGGSSSSSSSSSSDIEDKRRTNKFVPPTLQEVQAYIREKKLSVNAEKFFAYFTEGNWSDSKGNKVKNWKQKLLTWESHGNGHGNNNPADAKVCVVDRDPGVSFQVDKEGKKVYLCADCKVDFQATGNQSWGRMSPQQIEKLVLAGRAKRGQSNA